VAPTEIVAEHAGFINDLRPIETYTRQLRPVLPADAFAPARSRLLILPINLAILVVAITAIGAGWVPWWGAALLSLVIALSFGSLTFLAHETLHGSVVRNPRLRHLVGWFGFAPFLVSPRLWVAWHNRAHHGHAQQPGHDPDAFPTLEQYRTELGARVATNLFAIGGGRLRGGLSLIFGFTVQSADMLIGAGRRGFLSPGEHRRAWAETGLAVALWTTIGILVGPLAFLFVFVVPLLLANVIVMSYILSNHALSPRTEINDPLVNSLSVTVPSLYDWYSLGFGFHVEHHLFPAMSSRRSKMLRGLIRERWPERYQSMSLGRALWALHRTARVYKDDTTLLDPATGREYPALAPRA
jgi:fatty acid desaturase